MRFMTTTIIAVIFVSFTIVGIAAAHRMEDQPGPLLQIAQNDADSRIKALHLKWAKDDYDAAVEEYERLADRSRNARHAWQRNYYEDRKREQDRVVELKRRKLVEAEREQ